MLGLRASSSRPALAESNVSGTVARAFEIAPECSTIDEIRAKLKSEGFENVHEHLQGGSIQRELRKRLRGRERIFNADA